MRIHQHMLPWQLLCVMVIGATAEPGVEVLEFPSNSYGDQYTNMAVFEGKVYVGAKNYIYVLNATDLRQMQSVRTCADSVDCNNTNVVLLVNKHLNRLITCGTGNSGVCEIRSLSDIGNVLSSGSSDLAVSSSEDRPVTFVLNQNSDGLYTGVTYGPGSYDLYMANYSISNDAFVKEASMTLDATTVSKSDYIVYYKAGFILNGFIYFFTNQKYEAGGNIPLISKIIRICLTDGKGKNVENKFWSYTDIPLECRKDERIYNLVQDVTIFKPGEQLLKELNVTSEDWIIAATFTSGSRPGNLGSESAVCLYKLSEIDQHIMTAKKDFITCQESQFSGTRYLIDGRGTYCDSPPSLYVEYPCTDLATLTYIIGGLTTKMTSLAVYTTTSSRHGLLGKIQATSIGEYIVAYIGTSNGQLLKLNVNAEKATVYENNEVDDGHTITALHLEDGGKIYYALSDRKLMRYESRNCDDYTTCEATMEAKNPLCGWCVYQNRSTFKDNSSCPYQLSDGHWLPSLTQCLKLNVEPKGLVVGLTHRVDLQFIGVTPAPISGFDYECEVRAGQQSEIGQSSDLRCKTSRVTAHTEGEVLLYVKTPSNKTVLLAQTDLLFYDCGYYRSCIMRKPDFCIFENKDADQLCGYRTADQRLCFLYIDSTIPLLPKSQISRLWPFSVAVQFDFSVGPGQKPRRQAFSRCGSFYNCRCGKCVGDPRAKCSWNSNTTTCVPLDDSSDIFIQQEGKCSRFQNDADRLYLPSGNSKNLTFNVSYLVNVTVSMNYSCKLNGKEFPAQRLSDSQISCKNLQETTNETEVEYKLEIFYGTSALDGENTVVVYNCEKLGTDCSVCGSLEYSNPNYQCDWCASGSSKSCVHSTTDCAVACDKPTVTRVVPNTAGTNGGIIVTIIGKELGSRPSDVKNITLAGVPCEPQSQDFEPSTQITCLVDPSSSTTTGPVTVMVNGQQSSGLQFYYKKPVIRGMFPTKGPQIGGTRLTIEGQDLGIGTRVVSINVTTANMETKCTNAEVITNKSLDTIAPSLRIECDTPTGAGVGSTIETVTITFDGGTVIQKNINFTYVENPEIDKRPLKDIASGGIKQIITGKKFLNAHKGFISMKCLTETKIQYCIINSNTTMTCQVPELCAERKKELINKSRRKRETGGSDVVDVEIIIHLDGVQQNFSIFYYSDPSFNPFDENNKVKLFESKTKKLTISGSKLNLVAGEDDVIVTVGVGNCDVIELRETNLTCVAPTNQPAPGMPGANFPEVNVTIGNVHGNLGYLQYVEIQEELAKLWIIIAAVIGCLLAVVVIVVVALLWKYKQKSKKMRDYQRHVEEQEMEIKQIFREEFADMHTSMKVVNNNLIDQGCPYHHYHQYVFNVLFPADKMDSHPLLQEPVVSNKPVSNGLHEEPLDMITASTPLLSEVTDDIRSKMKQGMEELESLIYNKYFLKSVIDSLEGQRKFGLKDKANMCGYICTILLGRMEYLQEILVDLLGNLVQESAGKKNQKVLFRRCETIAEKLLSNWLSLCLYPHLKSQSGYPLYLLYKATQLHMEAGPIDAITNDAKYTLSEEKLLKKYSQTARQGSDEPTFEAKCLTLNVVVDNCRDIKVCRVLDCDTITQVKDKCLTQIYVNYPASNLTVKPEELELEWHAGMSGSLRLRDEDNTSKKHGSWVRVNTLAHYNVQDGSNMALIDPQVADASQEQDYANLAQVQLSCPSPSECSIDSTDAVTASLVVDSSDRNVRYWHIVKPEEGTLAPGKSLIAELYLNRLLTFKQSILEYVKAIYDTVLKEDVLPAHVHYLYNLLDSLAKKNNVESDILHTWKSEIYPVRIWAHLMKKPSIVFDIKSPPYVETSMDVISQVFIECFSLEAHKFSKDSPTHKMIFNNEMIHYKEQVKQFYKEISVTESQSDSLRKYLEEVNRLQQQHASFNKMSALHKLYQQIEPYMVDIIDDLATNRDACKLHLDKKLEQINGLMEEE